MTCDSPGLQKSKQAVSASPGPVNKLHDVSGAGRPTSLLCSAAPQSLQVHCQLLQAAFTLEGNLTRSKFMACLLVPARQQQHSVMGFTKHTTSCLESCSHQLAPLSSPSGWVAQAWQPCAFQTAALQLWVQAELKGAMCKAPPIWAAGWVAMLADNAGLWCMSC